MLRKNGREEMEMETLKLEPSIMSNSWKFNFAVNFC